MPIFVAYDSVDVWANQHLFCLDEKGKPKVVAGVPPDYFSKTGQLWGNPLYDWGRIAEEGFSWWIARIRNDLSRYDLVRIDHFRGFEGYWEVPSTEKTAVKGRWVKAPGEALFAELSRSLGQLPIIAEDLGVITAEVEALRDRFHFPGMKILQFAFGSGADNAYLPHNHVRESVVYTGTHDNDTTVGWFASLKDKERERVLNYLNISRDEMPWGLIRTALASVADMAVVPLQDILSLDSSARMNIPGVARGNWSWRFRKGDIDERQTRLLRELTELYGRCEPSRGNHP
jgi:4-alpha-glucanotransferase